jgi:hypothetical protein
MVKRKKTKKRFVMRKVCCERNILLVALANIIKASKKVYTGYDVIDWLESWVLSPGRKEPPSDAVLKDLNIEGVKPLKPMKLYRGFNQGNAKTIEQYMKKSFGKELKSGDIVTIHESGYSSWTKDIKIAKDFATKELMGGHLHKKYDGFVVSSTISPKDMLVEIAKVSGIDSALAIDIREEKEIILKPVTLNATVVGVFKWKKP